MDKVIARENLLLLQKIFCKYRVKFRIGYGTLLGCVRDKDIILGDKDIDLVFSLSQKNKVEFLVPLLRGQGFELQMSKANYMYFFRKGVHVDFYFFSQRNLADRFFDRVSCGFGLWCIYLNKRFFDSWVEYDFLGERFFGLPVEWLDYAYGDWRVPRNKRGFRSRTFTSFYLMGFRDFLRSFFSKSIQNKVKFFYRGLFK